MLLVIDEARPLRGGRALCLCWWGSRTGGFAALVAPRVVLTPRLLRLLRLPRGRVLLVAVVCDSHGLRGRVPERGAYLVHLEVKRGALVAFLVGV